MYYFDLSEENNFLVVYHLYEDVKGGLKARLDFGGATWARCVKNGCFLGFYFDTKEGKACCKSVKEGVEYFAVVDGAAVVFNIKVGPDGCARRNQFV